MFTRTASYAIPAAMLYLVLCFSAQAHKIEVGTGIFCDTQKQVERVVALFEGDMEAAVDAVNAEENNPSACVAGTIAYIRGAEIATARTNTGTFQIVQVLVVGILTKAGIRPVVPAAFFSVEQIEERAA
jgi:hypothetical protein